MITSARLYRAYLKGLEDTKRVLCFALKLAMMGVVSSIGALPVVAQPSIANTPTPASTEVRLEPIAYGLDKPVGIAVAPGQGDRLYIIEKDGLVKIFADGKVRRSVFLDIEDLVSTGTEQGLLGLAFPPSYPNDKRVFVYFTDRQGDSIIGTFSPETNDRLDEESLSVVLKIVQPAANHNGGQLAFGPDGYLYIGLGDGGGQGDPSGNAQNKSSMLGKILRIDVSETGPYKVPRDNPLSPGNHSLAEIWALGFRNPWRFSFDRATGRLFAADVGENSREEINIVERGKNYGWNTFEGTSCFKPPCDASKFTPPIAEYAHDEGRSVTGGFVYRGRKISKLNGCYIFGDHGSGTIWYLTEQANSWKREVLFKTNRHITSFGEDAEGELYVATLEGEIAKITTKE